MIAAAIDKLPGAGGAARQWGLVRDGATGCVSYDDGLLEGMSWMRAIHHVKLI